MLILALIDLKYIYKYAYIFFFLCLLLLFSVQIIGTFGKGAERWIHIFGVSVQPSELIKVGIILALAKFYHNLRFDRIGRIQNLFVPIIIIIIPFVLIINQPDLGTAVTVIMLGTFIMFAAGVKIWKFILGFIVMLISIPFLWNFIKPYQQKRIIQV